MLELRKSLAEAKAENDERMRKSSAGLKSIEDLQSEMDKLKR